MSTSSASRLGGVKDFTSQSYTPQFPLKRPITPPPPQYSPTSPSYEAAPQTSRKRKLTLDDLLVEITEDPDNYKSGPYLNASDLNQILKQQNIQLVPSKRLCRLVLESLKQQGALNAK